MPTYSIWRDASGELTLVQGEAPPRIADDDEQGTTHVMVRQFQASTWEKAIETLHQYQDTYGKNIESRTIMTLPPGWKMQAYGEGA